MESSEEKSFIQLDDLPVLTCCLCIDEVRFKDSVSILLPCGHCFHYSCFVNLKRSVCPLCRTVFDIPCTITTPSISTSNSFRTSNEALRESNFLSDQILILASHFY